MNDMPPALPPLHWHTLLHVWEARPVWDAVAVLALVAYLAGVAISRRHGVPTVHPARVVCWVVGLVLLVFTLGSAIDVYAMALFWDHMIEHLMLIMVVPAFLVLGHPLTVLRSAAATRGRGDAVERLLRSAPVALLTHPAVGVALYSVVVVGTHLTGFMDAMAAHPLLMDVEQVLYLGAGYLFLLTLIGNEPIRWKLPNLGRVALVLLAMTPDTVVGIVLMQTNENLFPVMEGAHPMWAPAPVRDIQIGGGLMWAAGDGLMMLLGVGVIIALIRDPAHDSVLGKRLEGIRRGTLTSHIARGDATGPALAEDISVDDDDAMLDAYNRMLGRLDHDGGR